MPPRDILAALTVVTLWGLNFIAVKVALVDLPPFLLTAMRFAGVALALAPFFRPRRDQIPGIVGIGMILGVGHFGLMFLGLSKLEAATTAIATQLGVPFSALLAWAVFGERLGWARGLGLVLAFGGILLLAGEPQMTDPVGLVIVMVAMMAWALSNVQVKRVSPIDPLALNGWMAVFAAPMLLGMSLALEDGQWAAVTGAGWATWAGLAFTVLGSSLVAYTLWYRLLARHSMNRVVPITLLGPVVGVAGGVLGLGEALTWQKLVGGAVIIAGVAVVQFMGGVRPPPAEPEPGA